MSKRRRVEVGVERGERARSRHRRGARSRRPGSLWNGRSTWGRETRLTETARRRGSEPPGRPARAAIGGQQAKRGRERRAGAGPRGSRRSSGPLARVDPPCREVGQLGGERVAPRGHQVHEPRLLLETERRPVEVVVAHEARMLLPAATFELDPVHRRVLRARQLLEPPEARGAAPTSSRAGDRLKRYRVVSASYIAVSYPMVRMAKSNCPAFGP